MNPFASAPNFSQQLGRWIAIARQAKDTVTIAAPNLLVLVPMAWSGLLFYARRWPLTRRHAEPGAGLQQWGLTLVHEVLALFSGSDPKLTGPPPYSYGYTLGVGLALAGLAPTAWRLRTAAETAAPQ